MKPRLHAFVHFLLGVAVVFVANFLAGVVAPQSESLRRFDVFYRPLLLVFLFIGFSILLTRFDHVSGNPVAEMGLALRPPWLRDLWAGFLLGSGMVAIAVAWIAMAGSFAITVLFTVRTVQLAGVVFVILGAGAMAEEVSFRGYPFQRLIDAIGAGSAVVVLSVLFGAVHFLNPHASLWGFLNTVLIGVLLSLAYLRTRSLWMPVAIHFGWNLTLGFIFGLPVSGLTEFSVVLRGHAQGPAWLTGGSYGIEAGVVGTSVIVLGIVLLVIFVQPRTVPLATQIYTPEVCTPGELSAEKEIPIAEAIVAEPENKDSSQSSQPMLPPGPQHGTGNFDL